MEKRKHDAFDTALDNIKNQLFSNISETNMPPKSGCKRRLGKAKELCIMGADFDGELNDFTEYQ